MVLIQHSTLPQSTPLEAHPSAVGQTNTPPHQKPPPIHDMEHQPTRSSRRIQGLAPQSYIGPSKAVFLPPELRVDVLARLDKRDLKSCYLPYITLDFKSEPFNSADEEINAFVEDYKNRERGGIYDRHKRDAFIVEGHKNHLKYAGFERHGLKIGTFLSKLRDGLRRLDNLKSVILSNDVWNYDLHERKRFGSVNPNTLHGPESGSPLVRSWNPLHLHPFVSNDDELEDEHFLICDHFYTLTTAIAETHRNIKSFKITHGPMGGVLPPQALTLPRMTETLYYRTLHAYSGLETLDISIGADGEDHDPNDLEALATLPRMLHQMVGLKNLELFLNTTHYYTYNQVFPALAVWPNLTQLKITGLAIGGYDLIRLLKGRAKVTDLNLCCIELLDGTWEGVFEGLCHMRLDDVRLRTNFTYRGGQLFAPHKIETEFSDTDVLEAVEDYVICGGRHPCLAPESSPEIAYWWYLDLMSDKELQDLKVFARRNDVDMTIFSRNRPSSAPAQSVVKD